MTPPILRSVLSLNLHSLTESRTLRISISCKSLQALFIAPPQITVQRLPLIRRLLLRRSVVPPKALPRRSVLFRLHRLVKISKLLYPLNPARWLNLLASLASRKHRHEKQQLSPRELLPTFPSLLELPTPLPRPTALPILLRVRSPGRRPVLSERSPLLSILLT